MSESIVTDHQNSSKYVVKRHSLVHEHKVVHLWVRNRSYMTGITLGGVLTFGLFDISQNLNLFLSIMLRWHY